MDHKAAVRTRVWEPSRNFPLLENLLQVFVAVQQSGTAYYRFT